MESTGAKEFSTLADYVAVLRRRKTIVLLAVVLVPVAALFYSVQQQKVYEASADVLLNPSLAAALTGAPDQLAGQQADRFVQTQAALARVPPVLERAAQKAGVPGETAGALLDSSSVSPALNADLLRFRVQNGDPEVAVQLVNAYAQAYTRYRAALDTSSLTRAKQQVNVQLSRLRNSGIDPKSGLYAGLLDKEQQLTILQSLQVGNTSVVQRAGNGVQIAPRPVRNGILGLLFGAVLGVGLAFLIEALDRRVRSHREIERSLGIPFLGWLPKPSDQVGHGISPAMLARPHSGEADAVRRLKATLELANLTLRARTIMISSAGSEEGKSTTAANLAVALAQAGARVVLIDADIRNPTLTEFFQLHACRGLSDVALGRALIADATRTIPIPGARGERSTQLGGNGRETFSGILEVVPAGTAPQEAAAILGTSVLDNAIAQLREQADYVLLDAPPLLGVGDAMALSAKVDAVLLVAKADGMDQTVLEELGRAADACPSPKLGFVITGAPLGQAYGYPGAARRAAASRKAGEAVPTR
jgi:polysaccharide biosynthesis transport protein